MARLELAILKFLARRLDGCQDLVDIFRTVMDPSPVDPGKWREMCAMIEEMEQENLVRIRQEKAEGNRLITRVCLTATGWQKLREVNHGKSG